MKPISPIEALGPAFERTRQVFGTPFRLGFFLKIALIAALTQPSFLSSGTSYPMQAANIAAMGGARHSHPLLMTPATAGFGLVVLLLVVIAVVLWVLFTYLFCRLRFTLFDIVVYKRRLIGEAWRPYGRQTWRYFGLFLLTTLAFLLVAAVVAGPSIIHLIHILPQLNQSNPDPFAIIGAILPFIFSIVVILLLWAIVDAVMQDFLLPPMAIEDAPIEDALSRFWTLVRTGFGSFLLYMLMRFVVALGLSWIMMVVVFMVLALLALGLGGVGLVLYHALWHSGTGGQIVFVAVVVVAALVVLALYLLALISVYGVTAVFKQSYAVTYFGGRYPELGSRLDGLPPSPATPPVAPIFEPPPIPPSPPPLTEPPALW